MNSIILLSIVGLFTMIIGLFQVRKSIIHAIVLISLLAAAGLLITEWNMDYVYFNDMLFFDNFAVAFSILLIAITFVVLALSELFFKDLKEYITEHYSLFIFSLIGMLCVVSFDHLAMLFIGIEIMSIPLFILAGSAKLNQNSNEASVKYFLMGAFATGLLLMGITLIYGETSTFHIDKIAQAVVSSSDYSVSPILIMGLIFLMSGMAFKVSLVPFHFWTPDVYQGAPTLVTTFMSTAIKIAGFAAFYRLFFIAFMPIGDLWVNVIAILSATTITIGGLSAVFQTNAKRMLAYSSISHAGYMVMVLVAANELSTSVLFYYSIAYAVASIVAFAIMMIVEKVSGSTEIIAFNGLAKSNPLLAILMTISMISLAGIPLTGGFFGKFFVLSNALDAGYLWLVIIAIINAIIGVYYYFKIIIAMYFVAESEQTTPVAVSVAYKTILVVCSIITIQLALFPDYILSLF